MKTKVGLSTVVLSLVLATPATAGVHRPSLHLARASTSVVESHAGSRARERHELGRAATAAAHRSPFTLGTRSLQRADGDGIDLQAPANGSAWVWAPGGNLHFSWYEGWYCTGCSGVEVMLIWDANGNQVYEGDGSCPASAAPSCPTSADVSLSPGAYSWGVGVDLGSNPPHASDIWTFYIVTGSGGGSPPTAPSPPAPPPPSTGTLAVCNVSGTPLSGTLTYTLGAPASAGGTQTVSTGVGGCTAAITYPVRTSVSVTQATPAGATVASITIGGGNSTLTANDPTRSTATVSIGTGQSTVTFKNSGTASSPAAPVAPVAPHHDCVVPNVRGLTLEAAVSALVQANCAAGIVTRRYSSSVRKGHVISQNPPAGSDLGGGAEVDLAVSRGRKR